MMVLLEFLGTGEFSPLILVGVIRVESVIKVSCYSCCRYNGCIRFIILLLVKPLL